MRMIDEELFIREDSIVNYTFYMRHSSDLVNTRAVLLSGAAEQIIKFKIYHRPTVRTAYSAIYAL